MRTGLLVLAAVTAVALVSGCGGGSTTPTPTPTPEPAPAPTPEPTPQPTPTPPPLVTVADILNGNVSANEVTLEGENIRTTGDSDELVFSDGTGEIVADYPSGNVPALNVRIRIVGRIASSEIDVSSWEPL